MDEEDLEEELLAVAGRSRGGSRKRGRRSKDSSDEEYGKAQSQVGLTRKSYNMAPLSINSSDLRQFISCDAFVSYVTDQLLSKSLKPSASALTGGLSS